MKNKGTRVVNRILCVLLVALMCVTNLPTGMVSVEAKTISGVDSWEKLKTEIQNADPGDVIEITADLAATDTITIDKDITIQANGTHTIFQQKRDKYDSMFKVTGGTLTLGEGLTLSGKIGDCQSAKEKTLNDFATQKDVPGDAEPEEHTKDNPNAKKLDDFKQTTGATYTGVISDIYLRDFGGGKWLTSINQGADVTFTIDKQGRLKVGENEYFETNYQGARLKTVVPSNPLYVRNTSGGTYNGEGTLVLYNSGLSEYFINPDPSSVITGNLNEAKNYTATMTASGGSTAWVIPDPDEDDKEKTYTTENDAKAALQKYNEAKYPGVKYYTVPGDTTNEYESKDDPNLIAAMEAYNEENTKTISVWVIDGQEFINPDQQAAAEQALEEYNNNLPSGCDLNNAACPVGDNAYTATTFDSGTTDDPHGFFVEVTGGTATAVLDGAILENFNTSRDKDTTPKFVAPVVAKNDGVFNINKGEIRNNIVGYVVNDSKANESADKIKKYVKGAAPNAQRTAKRGAVRRNVVAGIDGDIPGSGITGTAGAVIYANGGTGTVSGGKISNNRGDTGGIFVTGEGSKATLDNGTDINNNVGVQFGGGTTVEDGGFIAMKGGSISQNVAWFGGGAVFATENGTKWLLKDPSVTIDNRKDGYFTMDGGTLDSNTSFTRGGAILADSDGVSLIKGTLSNNMARMLGGAVYVMGDHPDFTYTVYIEKGYVHENKAVSAGYKGTVATTATLPRYDKESNKKLSKKLVAPDGCNTPTSLFNGDMTVNSDDLQDGYPNDQKYSTDGTGGGVWLCSYGNTTLDLSEQSQFYIDNNTATGSLRNGPISAPGEGGDDFHKDTKNNGSIIITGITAEDKWYDQNLGESGTIYAPAEGEDAINDSGFRNLINNGDAKPEGYDKATYAETTGVDVYGNLSRRGGGLAADGSFVFGKQQDTANLFAEMAIKKSWAEGIEKKPIAVKVYVESGEDKIEIATVPLTGTAKESSELDTVFDDGTNQGDYTGRLILPAFVEKRDDRGEFVEMVPVFDIVADGNKIDLNSVEGLTALAEAIDDPNKEVKLSSEGRKLVFEEFVITGYDGNGAPILEKTDDFILSPGKVSLGELDSQIKKIKQRQTDGTEQTVVTASISEINFNADIANDKPAEIEKYVNEAVHKAIAVNEVFDYDIVAYVREDADKIVITDTLVDDLEFATDASAIKIYDLGKENNHKVTNNVAGVKENSDATVAKDTNGIANEEIIKDDQILKQVKIDGQTLTVTLANKLVFDNDGNYQNNAADDQLLTDLHGHWVKVSFKAQIKKELQDKIKSGEMSVNDLEYVEVKADEKFKPENSIYGQDEETGEELFRPTPNEGNAPVDSDEDHEGIINTASYSIEVGNTPTYKDESNTVTVKPEEPEIEKYIEEAVHKYIAVDDTFTYNILAYITKDADAFTIKDSLVENLELAPDTEINVYDLVDDEGQPLDNNHLPVYDVNGQKIDNGAETPSVTEGKLIDADKYVLDATQKGFEVKFDDEVDSEGNRESYTVANLRGHWVRVEFVAQLTDEAKQSVKALSEDYKTVKAGEVYKDENSIYAQEDRPLPNTGNDPVKSDEDHTGIINTASYSISVGNQAKYEDESNTVTVQPEEPEIEKYVNEAVHDYIAIEDTFTYNILAYITKDADAFTISDNLIDVLEFVPDTTAKVYDLVDSENKPLDNNHLPVYDVNGKAIDNGSEKPSVTEGKLIDASLYELVQEDGNLSVSMNDIVNVDTGAREKETVKNLRGHWVRVEFEAQIKKDIQAKLLDGSMTMEELQAEYVPVDANDPVVSEEAHEGLENSARYTIDVRNEFKYEDESNVVTVQPEKPEIEKFVNKAVHKDIELREVFTYDIVAYVTKDADEVEITDTLNEQLQFVSAAKDIKVVDLGTENNHKPVNNIYSKLVNEDATVNEAGEPVDANVTISGQDLSVKIADATNLRGHWVKVTFDAKIKNNLMLSDLVYTDISDATEEERDVPNVGNDPVVSDEDHRGVINNANYTITVDNKPKYKDKSNTVTVIPKTGEKEITVSKTWDDEGLEERRPETIDVKLLKDGEVIEVARITERGKWTYTFTGLAEEGEYTIEEVPVSYYITEVRGDADEGFELINHTRPWIPETPDQDLTHYGKFTYYKTGGAGVSKNKNFTFEVTLIDQPGTDKEKKSVVKGELKVGESKTLDYILDGTMISVVETNASEYKVTYKLNDKKVAKGQCVASGTTENIVEIHNSKVPETSDHSNIMMWMWMCIASVAVLLVVLGIKKVSKQ